MSHTRQPIDDHAARLTVSPEFRRAFAFVVGVEGGFVDDPHDKGGPTKHGVALRFVQMRDYDRDGRPDFDLDGDGDVDLHDIRRIQQEDAELLYWQDYWSPMCCSVAPWPVALVVFDGAVNQGKAAMTRIVQRALGLEVDGKLGPKTVQALLGTKKAPLQAAHRMLLHRGDRYRLHPQADRYFRGWLARLFDVHKAMEAA